MYLSIDLKKILLLCSVLAIIASCSSGGGGSSNENTNDEGIPIVLEDTDHAFAAIGITNIEELRERISATGALALTVDIQNANDNISSEKIVGLLKANNRNIEYQKLVDQGIDPAVIAKLNKIRFSPVSVEQSVQLPNTDLFPMSNVTDDALALLNQAKLDKLNRKLRLAGQAPLTMPEFLILQLSFQEVDMVDNFGNLDQQFQNVLARDTIDRSTSRIKPKEISERLKRMTPAGYQLVNPVDELRENGLGAGIPAGDQACRINRLNLPMVITNPNNAINTNLVTSSGNDATVMFPETGIAIIAVTGFNTHRVTIKNSDDQILNSSLLDHTRIYYLPITNDDLCKPYTFEGGTATYNITVLEMIKPERVNEHVYVDGTEYISSMTPAELVNENSTFNAKSYTFSTINSTLSEIDILFELTTNTESEAFFNYVLYAPNGTIYTGSKGGSEGQMTMGSIAKQSGIWRLDILPKDSVTFSSNKISALTPEIPDFNSDIEFNLTTLITTDTQVQTKEFVLGTLKNVSLKTQGEDSVFDEGEITIDLNTSMSPKLNIPSYIDDLISSGDQMNDNIALWQCWRNSEKTGIEFESGAECYSYREEFLREKHLYETRHTYDYQNDPEIYQCRDQNGDEAECIRGELGPYNMENASETYKVQIVMINYDKYMQRQYQDVEYLHILSNYYDLYQNWIDRTVQVDSGQFPYDGQSYKTHEFTGCEPDDTDCINNAINGQFTRIPVVIETNRPIFGVPVERVNQSTLPITFDYTTSDQDAYDVSAANWAFVEYFASQALNIVSANFIGMVCDTIALTDDLHDVEMAAQDDPLGSAKASINRCSSSDPFYGLHNQDSFRFFMSGVPEENTNIDTYGQKLDYAQIACGVANLAYSGYKFSKVADVALSMDYDSLGDAGDIYEIIANTSVAGGSALLMAEAEEIYALIQDGNYEAARNRLKTSTNIDSLTSGRDMYDDLDSLLSGYQNVGSAGNGNNVVKSNAKFLLGTDKKTRAEVEFERVSSVPVANISVELNRVKILSNYEDDDKAEVRLVPFVGVVSDKPASSDRAHNLFSDSEGLIDGNHTWDYLRFGNVADGQTLETPNTILYSESDCGNVAAIYVELAINEDDSLSLEDDDMIGIFSQTIKLEEIFNANAKYKWTSQGGNAYQLVISEYPVYNSSNQLSVENPLSDDYTRQKAHNSNRTPSALVTLTINLTMGDIGTPYPVTDTSLDIGVMANGRDTYSMDMEMVSEINLTGRLMDVSDGKAIVGNTFRQTATGTIVAYGVEPYSLQELFSYDINDFAGDFAPIKEALTATKSIGRSYRNSDNNVIYDLSLVKLLPNSRLLFVFSHDSGAKIAIVSYTDGGVMTLENSLLIKDITNAQVYTLLSSVLSPDRSRLIVPYVPTDYPVSDKEETAHTKLNLYQIEDDNSITLLSANSFGNGDPITAVEFIDNTHITAATKKLRYGDTEDIWRANWETIQNDCTSTDLNCLYEITGQDLLFFNINNSNRFELTDSVDLSYNTWTQYYYSLKSILSWNHKIHNPELVSHVSGSNAILRMGNRIYQLTYDTPTDGFYYSDSTGYSYLESLRYNPEGAYYCANGITCSGHLKSAIKPRNGGDDLYYSDDPISGFEFANTDRDLVLGFSGAKLQLLSLYDGAAYKGPQITGDIFDTEISVDGSDSMTISFSVTDRDTPIADLVVTASVANDANGHNVTHIADLNCVEDSNGIGQCTGTISTDAFVDSLTLSQTVIISISDGVYTTDETFTVYHRPSILIPFADGTNGIEMWRTNGSTNSTFMLTDANSSGNSVYLGTESININGYYYFNGTTDGTDNTPMIASIADGVHPLNEMTDVGYSRDFVELAGIVYFIVGSQNYQYALWKTDGTALGTNRVKNFSSVIKIRNLTTYNGELYFIAEIDANNHALWKSDGSLGGTVQVKDGMKLTWYLQEFNGHLILHEVSTAEEGVWKSDGTEVGTIPVHEFDMANFSFLKEYDSYLYYIYYNSVDHNTELWRTNLTITEKMHTFEFNQFSLIPSVVCNNTLFFYLIDGKIWSNDGNDTTEVANLGLIDHFHFFSNSQSNFVVANDTLYFGVNVDNPYNKRRLYAIHPSTNNDVIEVDMTVASSFNFQKEAIDNHLVYTTEDDSHYYLWKHNVTDGKTLIKQTDK